MILRLFILALGLAFAAPVAAQGLGPEIPKATGDPHPEGNAFMRRYHMDMMNHDRDVTMYQGIRPTDASLAECFECHTVKDAEGTPVTYADERHFCRVCHDFTAVRVDCFYCHRSTPDGFEEPAPHAALKRLPPLSRPEGDSAERLQAYLAGVSE